MRRTPGMLCTSAGAESATLSSTLPCAVHLSYSGVVDATCAVLCTYAHNYGPDSATFKYVIARCFQNSLSTH